MPAQEIACGQRADGCVNFVLRLFSKLSRIGEESLQAIEFAAMIGSAMSDAGGCRIHLDGAQWLRFLRRPRKRDRPACEMTDFIK